MTPANPILAALGENIRSKTKVNDKLKGVGVDELTVSSRCLKDCAQQHVKVNLNDGQS